MSNSKCPAVVVHCRNIAGVWRGTLKQCGAVARVFSPYLTSGLAEDVLDSEQPGSVEVHTRFDIEAFAAGASSLATLRLLAERQYRLFHVPRLYAKVFEHPDGFATIGSQNLTQRGTRNRETTVVVRAPEVLGHLRIQLDRWVKDRSTITLEMIAEAEAAILELKLAFASLRRASRRIERAILEAQTKRDDEFRRVATETERLRKFEAIKLKLLLPQYRHDRSKRFGKLGGDGRVPYEACYYVAREAMDWWINGYLRQAKNDARYLKDGKFGWEIRLGESSANRFVVELAIKWCRDKLMVLYPEDQPRLSPLNLDERKDLELWIRNAIIGHENKLFGLSYPVGEDGRLWLGNHGVNPPRTVAAILNYAGFK